MYKLVTTPDPILAEKAKPVTKFDKKLSQIVKSMEETLMDTKDPVGVGLAAPQVGLPMRIFQIRPDEKAEVRNFINPEIIDISEDSNGESIHVESKSKVAEGGDKSSKKGKRLLEGCLSIPNIWGYVKRKKKVTLSYQDVEGNQHEEEFKGFLAIIVQHEMDHLNGILFTKHVMEQKEKLYKSHKDENNEDVFEEISI